MTRTLSEDELIALNALFVFEWRRRWGAVAFAYVAFIIASSVYLAWHYAIDGYAAVAVSLVIYLATRRLMPNASNRSVVSEEAADGSRAPTQRPVATTVS